MLNVQRDLIGKTITGLIAVPGKPTANGRTANEIWMMQFSDGSYVEFVSPSAKRGLKRSARRQTRPAANVNATPQLALNVA